MKMEPIKSSNSRWSNSAFKNHPLLLNKSFQKMRLVELTKGHMQHEHASKLILAYQTALNSYESMNIEVETYINMY